MEQIKVIAVAPDASVGTLRDTLDCREINCIRAVTPDLKLIPSTVSLPFDAAVLYSEALSDAEYDFLERLYMSRKDIAIVLLCDEIGLEIMEKAMRCGITKVLSSDTDPDDICRAVLEETKRCLSRTQHATVREFESRVIGFYSSKGGSGTTTSAVNVAAALAAKGKKVAVIDLKRQFGDVATYLNVPQGESVADLAAEGSITPATVRSYLSTAECGIQVLAGPSDPDSAQSLTGPAVETVVSMMRSDFDYVILDLPSGMDDFVRTAMSVCDTVYLVLNPELSALKNAKVCMGILARYALADRFKLFITKSGHSFIERKDMESALGMKACADIPFDGNAVIEANNRGVPLVSSSARSAAARAYLDFTAAEFSLGSDAAKGFLAIRRRKNHGA